MKTQPESPATSGLATYVDQAVSRSAGAGWWGGTWPRNGSGGGGGAPNGMAWEEAYLYGRFVMSRLAPPCEAAP